VYLKALSSVLHYLMLVLMTYRMMSRMATLTDQEGIVKRKQKMNIGVGY